jgi:hypothetical protein
LAIYRLPSCSPDPEVTDHLVDEPSGELVYGGHVMAVQMLGSTRPSLIFRGTLVGAPGSQLNYLFPCPGRWTVHIPLDGGPWRWKPGGPQLSGGTDAG